MKKSILLGVIGLAACAATSYGQGFVILDNYNATGGLVSYGPNVPQNGVGGPNGVLGTGLLSGWTVGLYYVLGTPAISDLPGTADPLAPLALGTGSGATASIYDSTGIAGEFFSTPTFAVPGGAAGGQVTLELIAYDTAAGSWAGALGGYRGHSAPFVVTMQAGLTIPPTAQVGPAFSTFGVALAPIPEPGTLALAGLGGLSLLLFRRKKA